MNQHSVSSPFRPFAVIPLLLAGFVLCTVIATGGEQRPRSDRGRVGTAEAVDSPSRTAVERDAANGQESWLDDPYAPLSDGSKEKRSNTVFPSAAREAPPEPPFPPAGKYSRKKNADSVPDREPFARQEKVKSASRPAFGRRSKAAERKKEATATPEERGLPPEPVLPDGGNDYEPRGDFAGHGSQPPAPPDFPAGYRETAPPERQEPPAPPPTREEVERYRVRLEERLRERYNNLPEFAGNVTRVSVVLSQPVQEALDGSRIRAEFDQLVYDPWGRRIPQLEQEYFVVTFGRGGALQVRSDPSIRIGLDMERTFSERAPLPADPFRHDAACESPGDAPQVKMPDWWRPDFPELN